MSDSELLPLPDDNELLLRRSDLPKYLPIARQTFARWASEGSGPPYIRIGKRLVAYTVGDVKAWLARINSETETVPPRGGDKEDG